MLSNFSTKQKIIFVTSIFLSFVLGLVFENKFHILPKCYCKNQILKFYDNPKYIGQKLSIEESKLLKLFKSNNDKCFNNLNTEEKALINKINNKLNENINNNSSEVDLKKDLNLDKNQIKSVFKFKKCTFEIKKILSKDEMKSLKIAIKKLTIKEKIELYRGISFNK